MKKTKKKSNNKKSTKKISTKENNINNSFIIIFLIFIISITTLYLLYNKKNNSNIQNINEVDESGLTIVMKALLNENKQLKLNDIKRLVRDNRKNIDYRIRDSESKTLLMYAVFLGNTEIIEDIAKYGNLLDEVDNNGRTALHWAVYYNQYDAVVTLIKLGAKDYIKDNYSLTPIDIARYEGYEDIYEYLSNL